MANLVLKFEEFKKCMNNNNYDKAISVINEIINIPGRPAELSNASLKRLKAFCYSKKGDWESSFELIKSAFLDSGGGDDIINNELINISFSLFNKIFTNFESNQSSYELSKVERYFYEIRNLNNKPNVLNENLPKIEFRLRYEEFNLHMKNNNFDSAISKLNYIMENINSSLRPNGLDDANLINKQACILNNNKEDFQNAFKKIKQALQLSNSDSTIRNNYQEIGKAYISELFKKKKYDECESFIDKEYLQKDFIKDNYKYECFHVKGIINLEKKEYENAFELFYKSLDYFKITNDEEMKKNNIIGLINSGINVYKKHIIEKNYKKADDSFNKVCKIISDDKILNRYKSGCLIINLDMSRWEDAYKIIQSLKKESLEEEEKEIIDKVKIFILSNCISECLDKNDLINAENYLKNLYDLAPPMAFNFEVKLIKKKLAKQFENHEYDNIISFIDDKLKNLDKNKYAEFYSYLEQYKQDVQKEKIQEIYKEGKIDDYLNEIAKNSENQSQDKQEIFNLASEIFNNEAEKEIDKGNFEEAEKNINQGIEKQPDNINLLNTRAALNYEKEDFNKALKDINHILEKEPDNNKIINNKLNIIEKKYEKDNGQLNSEEKKYIKENCYKNEDINMKSKSIDIMLKISDKENINLTNNDINNIIQNIDIEDDKDIQNISVMSKSALLLKKELSKNQGNKSIKLDDKSKQLLEKSLNSEYKESKNNILSLYTHISNLEKKDMEKPLEVISENLKYNINTSETKESIKVLDHFIQKENSLNLNQDLKTNLIENLSQNDFGKEVAEESTDKPKTFINEIKDGVIKGVNRKMKNGNKLLIDQQKENFEIAKKSVNIVKHICNSKEGLSQKDLENIGNLVKKSNDENNSKEFNNFIKNEAIDIVELSFEKKPKQIIPENLMNELSKEIQVSKHKSVLNILNKVSDNQTLTKETSNNLIKLLNDDNINNNNDGNEKDHLNKDIDDEKYNISYQILSKQQENLDEYQKNVFEIAKNTKNLSDAQNNNNEVVQSINNISNIVEKGYHVNKHTEKQIQKIFDNKGDNEEIMESTTNLINTMAKNGVKVNSNISNKIIDKISKGENISKDLMKKLTASLINIISKCDVPKESINAFGSILKKYKDQKNFDEIELAVTGLNILSKMHYVMNQESIDISLDIISKNELDDKTLDVISETLGNIFLETDISDTTFNKLFDILNNNKKLYKNLSICLYNSLKYKKQEQIDKLLSDNLDKLENAVNEGFFNEQILNILKKSPKIISKSDILKKSLELDELCNKLSKTSEPKEKKEICNKLYNYKLFKNFTSTHFKIIQDNICCEDSIKILKELLEKDFDSFQNEINIEKIFNYYNYNLDDVLDILKYISRNKDISNEILFQLLKIIINENNNIRDKIINIFESIQNIRKIPDLIEKQIKLEKNDLLDIEIIEHLIFILKDSNSTNKRYIEKIFNNFDDDTKKESLGKLIIYLINKKIKLPDKLIEKYCASISGEKIIDIIHIFLSNENISDNYKKTFSDKLEKYLVNIKDIKQKRTIIDKLILYCKFSKLASNLQKNIISSINEICENKIDYGSYLYWLFDNPTSENKELNKLIFAEIKKSKFKDDYEPLTKLEKDKVRREALLNENIIIDKLLKDLSKNDNELKKKLDDFISSISSKNKIKKNNILIISLVQSFINQRDNYDLSIDELLSCLGKLQMEFDINEFLEKIKNQRCVKYIKKMWVFNLLDKKKVRNININGLDIKQFIYNKFIEFDFSDELIEKFINLIEANFLEFGDGIKNFFEFIKENISLLEQIKSAIKKIHNIISFIHLILQIKYLYIEENCHDKNKIDFCKRFIINGWKLFNIKKFIDTKMDLEPRGDEKLIKELQNEIFKNKLSFETKAKKGYIFENKNIIDIFAKCPRKDWELAVKNLCIIQKLGDKQQNDIDSLLKEIKEKNSDIKDNYLEKLKEYVQRIRKAYNCPIESSYYEEGISKDKISNFDKNDIKRWSESKRTKTLIKTEESFLIEALAVINRAYHLDTQSKCDGGYDIRDVQLLSVLINLLKPKDKGKFCQINTGEGKSSIVSILATIKALQFKYVDILSSSIVLAKRDVEEKKNFYALFGLEVSSTDDDDCYSSNIVYGDSLGFEGDALREIFKNEGKRLKNKERGFFVIIIDEVDSEYEDNLSGSTRLCAPFPSYSFLTILYPWIYNNLNVVENLINKKKFPDFEEKNREKFTINKLKELVNDLLNKNEKGFELEGGERMNIIIPKNLKEFIQLQIDGWCESAFYAKHYYKENYHYVIAKEENEDMDNHLIEEGFTPRHNYLISPVDYANTGVVSLHMQWSNGLSQMLQVKHGLKISTEDLTTTYMSHYNFLRKYVHKNENNIFGLTGTLGTKESQNLLSSLFNIEVCIIPPFKPSRYISLLDKTGFKNRNEWKEAIMKDIELNVKRKRVVLVICYTIVESEELYDCLKNRKFDENKMLKYQRNDIENDEISRKHDAGEVIFATNLAGRGTDISLTDLVEKNGGMHVIVTFLPSNSRVEQQAVGRTARSGKNGSGTLIVNDEREIEKIKWIRDNREDQRIINIKNNEIKNIKLMGDLFDKFISVYKDIDRKVGNERNQPDYQKDVEEKWGMWLKRTGLEDNKNNITESEANKLFDEFSNIKNTYTHINNPFNYLLRDKIEKALKMDEQICFYGKLDKAMDHVYGKKTDECKRDAITALEKTNKYIDDNIIPQLHGIVIFSKLATDKCYKLNHTIKEDLEEDIELKVNAFESLKQKLQEAEEEIKNALDNDNAIVYSHYHGIKNLTKDYDTYIYLLDLGIHYYYTIEIEIEKDYWGIFCCMFLGVLQVVGGIALKCFTGNDFGLIKEGLSDIKYGFDCLIGKEQFSWKTYGEKKKAFLINLAVNLAVSYFTGGLASSVNDAKDNVKDNVKDLLVEAGKFAVKKGVNLLAKNLIGDEIFKKIFAKVKEYINLNSKINSLIDKICNKLLDNEIFDKIICMDALVDNKNNLNNFIKKFQAALNKLFKFSNSLSCIIKVFKSIIDNIKSEKDWLTKLTEIFKIAITNIRGLTESIDILANFLTNINGEVFGILEKQTQGFSEGINNFEDYINKKLIGNHSNLFNVLKKSNLITKSGMINQKLLFGNDGMNHIINKEFKNIWKIPENFFGNNMDNKFNELIESIDFNFSINSINFEEYSNKKEELIKILKNAYKKYEDIINKLKSFIGINKLDFGNFEIKEFETITNILPSSNFGNLESYIDILVNKIEFCNIQKDKVIEQIKTIFKMKEKMIDELKSLIGLNNLNFGNMSNFGHVNILNNSAFNKISQVQDECHDKINEFTNNFRQLVNKQMETIVKCKNNVQNMINNISKGVNFGISEQNVDTGISLDQINFGEFESKKDEIIDKLKNTMTRIEKFDIKKVKDEIIKNIRTRIKDCINDLLIRALHSTEFGNHVRNISNKFEEALSDIS